MLVGFAELVGPTAQFKLREPTENCTSWCFLGFRADTEACNAPGRPPTRRLGLIPEWKTALFGFVFRILGLFVLALALVFAVLDITRSITASEFVLTPLQDTWKSLSEPSLASAQVFVETWTHAFLWDPIFTTILKLPSWAIFWLVAMILLKIGERRQNPYGRFASR